MEKTDGTIIEFINGSHSYDGVWFGEPHPDTASKYWWRPILKECLAGLEKSTSTVQGLNKEGLIDILRQHLTSDIYFCTRVWAAWQVGTMSEDDFTPVNEDDEFIYELSTAILASLPSPPSVPLSNKEDIEKMAEAYEYGKDDMREGIAAGWIDGNKRGWDMSTDWPEHGYDFADKYLKNKA